MTTADEGVYAPTMSTRRPWVDSLSSFWQKVRRLYRLLLPIRFSFIADPVCALANAAEAEKQQEEGQ
jgi:hypothetical protein